MISGDLKQKIDYFLCIVPEYKVYFDTILSYIEESGNTKFSPDDIGISEDILTQLTNRGILQQRENKYFFPYSTFKKEEEEDIEEIPKDLFDTIIGYDDLKQIFLRSLQANKPVHIILIGTPATAKTMFLDELDRLEDSVTVMAGTSTKVGLRDIIADYNPRFLIIDELDKISNSKDLSALNSWMESGRLTIAKHGEYREEKGKGWVFAACVREKNIPSDLMSRFEPFYLWEYSYNEFIEVVKGMLTKREGVDPELAKYIAVELANNGYRNPRRARNIARLSKTKEDVDWLLSVKHKYTRNRNHRSRRW